MNSHRTRPGRSRAASGASRNRHAPKRLKSASGGSLSYSHGSVTDAPTRSGHRRTAEPVPHSVHPTVSEHFSCGEGEGTLGERLGRTAQRGGDAFNGPYISETQRITVWDVATGKNISTIQTGGIDAMDLVWLPGGKVAAVLYNPQDGSTGTVSVWTVSATGQLGRSPCTNQFPFTQDETTTGTNHIHFYVQHAQLSPDGKRLAVTWRRAAISMCGR